MLRDLFSGRLHVTFIDKEGDEHSFEVSAGDNLLDIAQANDLEMEGKHNPGGLRGRNRANSRPGACGGSCACSTCHVIVEDEAFYDKMGEQRTKEGYKPTSINFTLTQELQKH